MIYDGHVLYGHWDDCMFVHTYIYLICDDDENDDDVFVVVCVMVESNKNMYICKLMENKRRDKLSLLSQLH